MIHLFHSYFLNSINITFFILLLLLLESLLKKYFSAICLYRVWVVLLIGLLIPLRFDFIKPLFLIRSPRISLDIKVSSDINTLKSHRTNTLSYNSSSNQDSMKINGNNDPHGFDIFFKTSLDLAKHVLFNQYGYLIFSLLWLVGTILVFTSNIIRFIYYKKYLKRLITPLKQVEVLEEFTRCMEDLQHLRNYNWFINSLHNRTVIYECPVISSPMTLGIMKPIILIPTASYTKKELHFLLKHELVHIFRMDSCVKLIRLMVLSLNWYNPVCYLLSSHFGHWCETSCDEIVLHNSTKSDCISYSKLLLKCASTQYEKNTTILMNLYGGKSNMKQRLYSIMDQGKKRSGKLLIILSLGIIFTTTIVTITKHKEAFASSSTNTITVNNSSTPSTNNNNPSTTDTTQNTSTVTDLENAKEADKLRETIVTYANQAVNSPYLYGGNDLSTGVDCSGFLQAIYQKAGYDLPRSMDDQKSVCTEVSFDSLLPGDIIFYANSDETSITHVGMYIGDNKIIHAKNLKDNVTISDLNYRKPYVAGRIITD